ncbi:hypothetical protein AB0N64_14570 [Microbacterium sp. NPDC089318]
MPPAPALTASASAAFVPKYGPTKISGDAASLTLGARRYGIPAGAEIATPDDGLGRVVLVLVGDILHALTAAGEIVNMPPEAIAALGDVWLGRPDVRPPP